MSNHNTLIVTDTVEALRREGFVTIEGDQVELTERGLAEALRLTRVEFDKVVNGSSTGVPLHLARPYDEEFKGFVSQLNESGVTGLSLIIDFYGNTHTKAPFIKDLEDSIVAKAAAVHGIREDRFKFDSTPPGVVMLRAAGLCLEVEELLLASVDRSEYRGVHEDMLSIGEDYRSAELIHIALTLLGIPEETFELSPSDPDFFTRDIWFDLVIEAATQNVFDAVRLADAIQLSYSSDDFSEKLLYEAAGVAWKT